MAVVTHREPPRLRKNGSGGWKNTPRAFPSGLNRLENFYFTTLPIYRGHVASLSVLSTTRRCYECILLSRDFILSKEHKLIFVKLNIIFIERKMKDYFSQKCTSCEHKYLTFFLYLITSCKMTYLYIIYMFEIKAIRV